MADFAPGQRVRVVVDMWGHHADPGRPAAVVGELHAGEDDGKWHVTFDDGQDPVESILPAGYLRGLSIQ